MIIAERTREIKVGELLLLVGVVGKFVVQEGSVGNYNKNEDLELLQLMFLFDLKGNKMPLLNGLANLLDVELLKL